MRQRIWCWKCGGATHNRKANWVIALNCWHLLSYHHLNTTTDLLPLFPFWKISPPFCRTTKLAQRDQFSNNFGENSCFFPECFHNSLKMVQCSKLQKTILFIVETFLLSHWVNNTHNTLTFLQSLKFFKENMAN